MLKNQTMDIESARQIISEIKQRSKLAEHAYKPSLQDTAKLLEIIGLFGKKISDEEKMDYKNQPPAMLAVHILLNTIDVEVAELVFLFLKKTKGLDFQLELSLRSGIMRMRGF